MKNNNNTKENTQNHLDYYQTTTIKVIDFFIGFFLNIFIAAIHYGSYWLMYLILDELNLDRNDILIAIIPVLLAILLIVIEYKLTKNFFKKRRYLAIGMLSALILPLLVTGFCSMVFWSM